MIKRWISVLVGMLLVSACSGASGGVTVQDAWVRAALGGAAADSATPEASAGAMAGHDMAGMDHGAAMSGDGQSAGYMTIVNPAGTADTLLSVTTDAARSVELHTSEMHNNVMTMQQVQAIDVPANGQIQLKSGGTHLMLIGLTRELKAGETITLKLRFERAGEIDVQAQVRDS